MAKVVKDPDDTWFTYVDWTNWISDQETKTGGTITITGSDWTPEAGISQVSGTPTDDESEICIFFGSGGTVNTDYTLINQITYTLTVGSTTKTGLMETRTITVAIRDK